METIITSIFYITVLFNGKHYNLVSCNDWRHLVQDVTITRVLPKVFLAKDKTDGKVLKCFYTK